MSWEMLPSELQIYILKIRNEMRNNASKKIQKAWFNYIYPEIFARNYASMINIDEDNEIMTSLSLTELILKFCLENVSGKYNLRFWKTLAHKLDKSLDIYNYDENEWLTPQAINYRKIKVQYLKLLKKFNFE